MKRVVFLILAISMMMSFSLTVSALEDKTGSIIHELKIDSYTRLISQQGFTGEKDVESFNRSQESQDLAAYMNSLPFGLNMQAEGDNPIGDLAYSDMRARILYQAMFDKNLFKFVTEVDLYGVAELSGEKDLGITDRRNSRSDSGTDKTDVELINLYAEYNPNWERGIFNFGLGWMDSKLARGLVSNEDSALQAQVVLRPMEYLFLFFNYHRGDGFGIGRKRDDAGTDNITFVPAIVFGENSYIAPFWTYARARGERAEEVSFLHFTNLLDKLDLHKVGIDINSDNEKFDFWFSGVYQFGDLRLTDSDNVVGLGMAGILPTDEMGSAIGQKGEFDGWLLNMGSNLKVMPVLDIHGEFIFATGEETSAADSTGINDGKLGQFVGLTEAQYPWAEIMGVGMFGNQYSAGSPGDEITNLVAYNLGATVKPIEKLAVTLDIWYAELEEPDSFGNTKLGTELDLKIGYEIIKDLKLDMVLAHLWAGDATSLSGRSTEDPYEIGIQLTYNLHFASMGNRFLN